MASACVYIECPVTGRILGVSRRDDPNAWGLPGGKVDPGETEKTAATRELYEETGVFVFPWNLKEVFRRDGGVTYQARIGDISCVEEPREGEPRWDWVTVEQLLAGPFGDYNRRLLEALGRDVEVP
jgi:8-oxo-dGTP pyrophosphatase MutT (NUDIX family)